MGWFGYRVKLPRDIYDRARERAGQAGYGSVEEYVTRLVERDLEGEEGRKRDEEETRRRLEGLGYIS